MPAPDKSNSVEQWVRVLRTLADPVRMRILQLMDSAGRPALRVGELADALKMPQSTISRHLKTLLEADLIEARRQGTAILYRPHLNRDIAGLKELRSVSRKVLHDDDELQADLSRLSRILEQQQEDAFAQTAPEWDSIREQWFGDKFQYEAMLAALDPGWAIADIGAGTASLSINLAPHVRRVYAIEPSPAMLKAARQRLADGGRDNVEIISGAVEEIPLPEASVHMALACLVLHHVADTTRALTEMYRILIPGGFMIIIDLLPHQIDYFREKMGHRWMGFQPQKLQRLAMDTGFTATRWHTLPARTTRLKDTGIRVPDIFVMRATKPHVASA
jgi:ubiquinone/menaquinone biosynthesis C-methylase UbiE/DNA-binding transcriptional ArsR family regulator